MVVFLGGDILLKDIWSLFCPQVELPPDFDGKKTYLFKMPTKTWPGGRPVVKSTDTAAGDVTEDEVLSHQKSFPK